MLPRKFAESGWFQYGDKGHDVLVTSVGCREISSYLGVVEF